MAVFVRHFFNIVYLTLAAPTFASQGPHPSLDACGRALDQPPSPPANLPLLFPGAKEFPGSKLSRLFVAPRPQSLDKLTTEKMVFLKTYGDEVISKANVNLAQALQMEAYLSDRAHRSHPKFFLPTSYHSGIGAVGALVTPFQVNAKNLAQTLEESLTLEERAQLSSDMAKATAALETVVITSSFKGISHGDIKPGNFLMLKDGLRIIDFGAAIPFGAPRNTAATAGTIFFAPLNQEQATFRDDLRSLQLTLYLVLTGERYPTGLELEAAFEEHFYTALFFGKTKQKPLPKYGPDFSPRADPYVAIASWTPPSQLASLADYADLIGTALQYSQHKGWDNFLIYYGKKRLAGMPHGIAAQTIVESQHLVEAFRANKLGLSEDKVRGIKDALQQYPGSVTSDLIPYANLERVQRALSIP